MRSGVPRITAVLLLAAACGAAAAQAPLGQGFDLRVPVPPTPVPTAGEPTLVYELHLTNFSEDHLALEHLEVLAGPGGERLASFGEVDVAERLFRPGNPDAGPVPPGATAILYLEIPLADASALLRLLHRVTYRVRGDAEPRSVQGAATAVRREPPVVLAPPVRGGPWAAVHSPEWPRGHRRFVYAVEGEVTIPGRHAIDWIRVDEEGRYARGDEDETANWLGYGAEVLAVADGMVVAARDDVEESARISEHPRHPLEDATGNYVAIEIEAGRIAFFEHLKPGSVRVQVGDRVRQGDVIAALGFTGHSTGPHLHFHLADRNSPLGAEGVPFVMDEFALLGRYEDFARFGEAPWTPASATAAEPRRDERPPPNSVVRFR